MIEAEAAGKQQMRAQVEHMLAVSEMPNVVVQLLPFQAGGHAAGGGPFTVLRFAVPDLPDVVYLEQLNSAVYIDKRFEVEEYLWIMERLIVQAETPARTRARLRQLAVLGVEDGRAQRRGHQLAGGAGGLEVGRVDDRHRSRARIGRHAGVDGLRHARRVRDGVGAAHAGGVLRREPGEAEVGGGLLGLRGAPEAWLLGLLGQSAAGGLRPAAAREQGREDEAGRGQAHRRDTKGGGGWLPKGTASGAC